MRAYGLNLHRVATFIAATLIMRGQVASVTLQVAETIRYAHDIEGGNQIIHMFAYGAQWNSTDPPRYERIPNYVPDKYAFKIDTEIEAEVGAGRYVSVNANTAIGIAAIGIVDKEKSGMIKVRIVHDLSRPFGASVNSHTNIIHRKFATVKQACEMLQPEGWMAKCDLTKAYRSIPTAPRYWRLHVLEWRGIVYSDLRMPFGNRAAPGIFDQLTQTLVQCLRMRGFPNILGYIDDFWLTVEPEDIDQGKNEKL